MTDKMHGESFIGILMLNTTFPRIIGDIGNPDTFEFPVRYRMVEEGTVNRVLDPKGDSTLIEPFVNAARELEREGAAALFTSCGFLAIFHKELVDAVDIPVFSSNLLQVRLARSVIKKTKSIGILTASARSLTRRHFEGAGIEDIPVVVAGMDAAEEFNQEFVEGGKVLNVERCRKEIVSVATELVAEHPDIGALVLECTNMAPFSDAIQQAVKLPIFDVNMLIRYVYSTLVMTRYKSVLS